jgi:glycosyltransferase involved in cell wall biosynthesis
MSADPKVSVIMPVRDGQRWLAQAVESVLGQTLSELELIVVNDGSIDQSSDILSALSRRDNRLRIVHQRPEGLVKALNQALALARAPLVARLDADDVALPERLVCQTSCFDKQAPLVLLGSWAEKIDDEGRCIGHVRPETEPEQLAKILPRKNPFVHSSVMMRTALAQRLGGYRYPFLGAEDFDLWLRMSEHGAVANLPQALVRYRVHGDNTGQSLGVRQSFSARLAQVASAARRASGFDPADRLLGPPDWWAFDAPREFYAEVAQICRFLDLADPRTIEARRITEVRLPSLQQILDLSHAEKRLARRSIFNLLTVQNSRAPLSFSGLATVLLILLIGRVVYRGRALQRDRGRLPQIVTKGLQQSKVRLASADLNDEQSTKG